MNKPELTIKEIENVAAALGKLEPGYLPLDIFRAIARLVLSPFRELSDIVLTADRSL